MLKKRTGEEYSTGLGRILEDTQRLEVLVSQMLQLARLEEVDAADVPVLDLGTVLRSVAAQLQPIADNRGVQVKVQDRPDLFVRLQPESAEVLVSNLLMNAVQHSRAHASVSLSAAPAVAGGVRLEVVDHGDGIGPEALPHIFARATPAEQAWVWRSVNRLQMRPAAPSSWKAHAVSGRGLRSSSAPLKHSRGYCRCAPERSYEETIEIHSARLPGSNSTLRFRLMRGRATTV